MLLLNADENIQSNELTLTKMKLKSLLFNESVKQSHVGILE
jgi:hypothetical protein